MARSTGLKLTRREALALGTGAIAGGLERGLGRGTARAAAGASAGEIFFYGEMEVGAGMIRATFAVDPGTGIWRKVTDAGMYGGRVSADGRTLAYFERTKAMEGGGIWTCPTRADGIPTFLGEILGSPSWSPDGKALIVSGSPSGSPNDAVQTWRVEVDGGRKTRLPLPETDHVLDWSPDGQWLLVSSARAEPGGEVPPFPQRPVDVVRPDGTGRRPITEGGAVCWRHRFADGRHVVFFQVDPGDECNLWVAGLDGEEPQLFIREGAGWAPFRAVGSPDGREVAILLFDRSKGRDGKKNDIIRGCRIAVAAADGTHLRRLDLPSSGRLELLDWRPTS